MKSATFGTLVYILSTTTLINSQQFSISDSLNAFGINLLGETINQAGDSLNVALSTYTVWTLMTIISEGSRNNTARQLENTLRIPQNKLPLRNSFQNYTNILLIGIKDVFEYDKANLLGIFDHYLYLSRLIQKAEIEVNEEGTVASAASGAFLQNKSQPPKFRANRPFLYFIVDKPTRSIVFSGKVSNPNTLN